MPPTNPAVSDLHNLIDEVCRRVAQNKRVRRRLPDGGRLHIDRQLPFLCIFRLPASGVDDGQQLVTSEASYLIVPAAEQWHSAVVELCQQLVETLCEVFGAFLLVEVWERPAVDQEEPLQRPAFRIMTPDASVLPSALEALQQGLAAIRLGADQAEVELLDAAVPNPPELPPLLPSSCRGGAGCFQIGIEVQPVYWDRRTGNRFPLLLRALRRQFSQALQRAFCSFAGIAMVEPPEHYQALGRRELLRFVGNTDDELCNLADSFDFLLLASPKNSDAAWEEFRRQRFQQEPQFFYHPLPFDPDLIKRQLYALPLEQIEDPTLSILLSERRDELDLQITMLRDRETPRFLYSSLQLYGPVEGHLLDLARRLLNKLPAGARPAAGRLGVIGFVRHAEREIAHYRQLHPQFKATIELRDDIAAGVMVSEGRLLIDRNFHVARNRVRQLVHHEIGTHLLTYFNGRAQPLRQLATGLAGYESLQEGLAVLAEYLAGGLNASRLSTLAARVVACHAVGDGATFLETFRLLHRQYGLSSSTAFTVAMRAHRGGGLTKDAIYLRGLQELLSYLRRGRQLEPLFVGKIALRHVPIIQELRRREIVQPPPLRPRYLDEPGVQERLDRCCSLSLMELVETQP